MEQLFYGMAGQGPKRRCCGLAKAKAKSHFKDGVRRLCRWISERETVRQGG